MPDEQLTPTYDADFLVVYHKTVDFLADARFQTAYRQGSHRRRDQPGMPRLVRSFVRGTAMRR